VLLTIKIVTFTFSLYHSFMQSMIFSCGYILKPPCTRLENFDPYNTNMLEGVRPVTVNLTVSVFGCIFCILYVLFTT
jgi:hypothetical protein